MFSLIAGQIRIGEPWTHISRVWLISSFLSETCAATIWAYRPDFRIIGGSWEEGFRTKHSVPRTNKFRYCLTSQVELRYNPSLFNSTNTNAPGFAASSSALVWVNHVMVHHLFSLTLPHYAKMRSVGCSANYGFSLAYFYPTSSAGPWSGASIPYRSARSWLAPKRTRMGFLNER